MTERSSLQTSARKVLALHRAAQIPKACPFCGTQMVLVAKGKEPMTSRIFIEPLNSRAEGTITAGPNILVGYTSCPKCGFLALHNFTALGIDPA